jgi:hypothetical protein
MTKYPSFLNYFPAGKMFLPNIGKTKTRGHLVIHLPVKMNGSRGYVINQK